MKNPQIRIRYGTFLEPIFEAYYKSQPEQSDWVAYSREKTHGIIEEYIAAWNPHEKKVLDGLAQVTGLAFRQNIIDVYIVSSHKGGFSDPMIIGAQKDNDTFVNCLIHELAHRIVTDNTKSGEYSWRKAQATLYPNETDVTTINHIFIHAILKAIYLDILKEPERLTNDIERCKRFPSYKKAWEIVEAEDYKKIIADLKKEIFGS